MPLKDCRRLSERIGEGEERISLVDRTKCGLTAELVLSACMQLLIGM